MIMTPLNSTRPANSASGTIGTTSTPDGAEPVSGGETTESVASTSEPKDASSFNHDQFASGEGIHRSSTRSPAELAVRLPGQEIGVRLTRPSVVTAIGSVETTSAAILPNPQLPADSGPIVHLPVNDKRLIRSAQGPLPLATDVQASSVDMSFEHQPLRFGEVRLHLPEQPLSQTAPPVPVEPHSSLPLAEQRFSNAPSVRIPRVDAESASTIGGPRAIFPEVQLVWTQPSLLNYHFATHKDEFVEFGITNTNDYHTFAQQFFGRPLGGSLEEFTNVVRKRVYRWDSFLGLLGSVELPPAAGALPTRIATLFRPRFSRKNRIEAAEAYVNSFRP